MITNAAEDVDDPKRTIPRAITTAILLVMGLYVLVSVVVFGSLTVDEVRAASDNALAAAARPVFGQAGFIAVSITALVACASAINASLFAVTNVAYQMAKDGELPGAFGRPVRHSREGLLTRGIVVSVLSVTLDLQQIAVLGSVSILLVHATVHAGHLRLTDETGANKFVVAAAALLSIGAIVLALIDASRSSWTILLMFAGSIAAGYGLHAMTGEDGIEPDDLDACRGHSDDVRGYHYHAASPGENMFIGCFHGEIVDEGGGGGGGGEEVADCADVPEGMPCCGDDVCDGPETADNCAEDCG